MNRITQVMIGFCLMWALLAGMSSGVAAAPAESVWVNGMQMVDGDYIADNDSITVTAGATEAPESYVAWYHKGTLVLRGADMTTGVNADVYGRIGSCGIYASGDLAIDLIWTNRFYNASNPLTAGIVVEGQLDISSEEGGKLSVVGNRIGILCNHHDLTISGNAEMSVSGLGNSVDISCGMMTVAGDIVICDSAKVDAYTHAQLNQKTVSVMYASDGNIRVLDNAAVSVSNYDSMSDSTASGLLATKVASEDGGNIICSGHVEVVALGYFTAISATENLTVDDNAVVAAVGIRYGIGNTKNVNISNGYLKISGGYDNGAAVLGNPKWNLTDSVLALVGDSEYSNCSPKEIPPIYFDPDRNTYFYPDGDIEHGIGYMFFRPKYDGDDFNDSGKWSWAMPYNYFVIENGIMGSVTGSPKYFDSNGTVTRGMVVTVMYRLADSPALSDADYAAYNNKFGDVEKDKWYYDAVVWAYNNNVTTGINPTTFGTNVETTREQIVTFFWRFCDYLDYDHTGGDVLGGYKDLNQVGDFAVDAFKWSVTSGIVNGTSETTLSPKAPCTRGQMAKIITYFALTFMEEGDWIDIGDLS